MFDEVKYWRQGDSRQNFGDFLSEIIAARFFHWVPVDAISVHLIGSVISEAYIAPILQQSPDLREARIIFWGCGLRDDADIAQSLKECCLFPAVRGPLTRKVLGLPENTVLGDPALLLPLVFDPPPSMDEADLLVPHFFDDRSDDALKAASGCDSVLRPEIRNNPHQIYEFLEDLLRARFVLCGSLHAAIVRAAYGLPFGFWNSGRIDVPFKWSDFAESVQLPATFFEGVDAAKAHWKGVMAERLRIPALAPLLLAAPYAPRVRLVTRAVALDIERHGIEVVRQIYAERDLDELWHGREELFRRLETALTQTRERVRLVELQSQEDVARAQAHAAQAEARTRQAETHAAQVDVLTANAESHARHVETRLSQIVAEYQGVLRSKSWKLTAPLRHGNRMFHWARYGAVAWLTLRPGSRPRRTARRILEALGLWEVVRPTVVAMTTRAGQTSVRHPAAALVPRVERALASQPSPDMGNLSPAAVKIYEQLRHARLDRIEPGEAS